MFIDGAAAPKRSGQVNGVTGEVDSGPVRRSTIPGTQLHDREAHIKTQVSQHLRRYQEQKME
jgi:hypothetical protein